MLAQLLTNRNNDTDSNPEEEGNPNNEHLKTEKSKKISSIGVDVIKSIQAQLTSLAQRDELKRVGKTHPYLLEWDSVPYPPKFKPLMLHTYDGKSSPNQHIYYSQTDNVIDNDALWPDYSSTPLRGWSLIGSGAFPTTSSIFGWT